MSKVQVESYPARAVQRQAVEYDDDNELVWRATGDNWQLTELCYALRAKTLTRLPSVFEDRLP